MEEFNVVQANAVKVKFVILDMVKVIVPYYLTWIENGVEYSLFRVHLTNYGFSPVSDIVLGTDSTLQTRMTQQRTSTRQNNQEEDEEIDIMNDSDGEEHTSAQHAGKTPIMSTMSSQPPTPTAHQKPLSSLRKSAASRATAKRAPAKREAKPKAVRGKRPLSKSVDSALVATSDHEDSDADDAVIPRKKEYWEKYEKKAYDDKSSSVLYKKDKEMARFYAEIRVDSSGVARLDGVTAQQQQQQQIKPLSNQKKRIPQSRLKHSTSGQSLGDESTMEMDTANDDSDGSVNIDGDMTDSDVSSSSETSGDEEDEESEDEFEVPAHAPLVPTTTPPTQSLPAHMQMIEELPTPFTPCFQPTMSHPQPHPHQHSNIMQSSKTPPFGLSQGGHYHPPFSMDSHIPHSLSFLAPFSPMAFPLVSPMSPGVIDLAPLSPVCPLSPLSPLSPLQSPVSPSFRGDEDSLSIHRLSSSRERHVNSIFNSNNNNNNVNQAIIIGKKEPITSSSSSNPINLTSSNNSTPNTTPNKSIGQINPSIPMHTILSGAAKMAPAPLEAAVAAHKAASEQQQQQTITVAPKSLQMPPSIPQPYNSLQGVAAATLAGQKRSKRFTMDPHVQKHFQLTVWYEEEKLFFRELFCAYGREWHIISTLMCGTKSPTQIKNFYYDVRLTLLAPLFGLSADETRSRITLPHATQQQMLLMPPAAATAATTTAPLTPTTTIPIVLSTSPSPSSPSSSPASGDPKSPANVFSTTTTTTTTNGSSSITTTTTTTTTTTSPPTPATTMPSVMPLVPPAAAMPYITQHIGNKRLPMSEDDIRTKKKARSSKRTFRFSRITTSTSRTPKNTAKISKNKAAEIITTYKFPVGAAAFYFYQHSESFPVGKWFEVKVLEVGDQSTPRQSTNNTLPVEPKPEDNLPGTKYKVVMFNMNKTKGFWVSEDDLRQEVKVGIEVWEFSADPLAEEDICHITRDLTTSSLLGSVSQSFYQAQIQSLLPGATGVHGSVVTAPLPTPTDAVSKMVESVTPATDRNKLQQWLEAKLESMTPSSGTKFPVLEKGEPGSMTREVWDTPAFSMEFLNSGSLSIVAKQKCFFECISSIFDEKDFIAINFASIFASCQYIADINNRSYIVQLFDNVLRAADLSVTMVVTRTGMAGVHAALKQQAAQHQQQYQIQQPPPLMSQPILTTPPPPLKVEPLPAVPSKTKSEVKVAGRNASVKTEPAPTSTKPVPVPKSSTAPVVQSTPPQTTTMPPPISKPSPSLPPSSVGSQQTQLQKPMTSGVAPQLMNQPQQQQQIKSVVGTPMTTGGPPKPMASKPMANTTGGQQSTTPPSAISGGNTTQVNTGSAPMPTATPVHTAGGGSSPSGGVKARPHVPPPPIQQQLSGGGPPPINPNTGGNMMPNKPITTNSNNMMTNTTTQQPQPVAPSMAKSAPPTVPTSKQPTIMTTPQPQPQQPMTSNNTNNMISKPTTPQAPITKPFAAPVGKPIAKQMPSSTATTPVNNNNITNTTSSPVVNNIAQQQPMTNSSNNNNLTALPVSSNVPVNLSINNPSPMPQSKPVVTTTVPVVKTQPPTIVQQQAVLVPQQTPAATAPIVPVATTPTTILTQPATAPTPAPPLLQPTMPSTTPILHPQLPQSQLQLQQQQQQYASSAPMAMNTNFNLLFNPDKSTIPYKLFIGKREILLECRRLLRLQCSRISDLNKQNIESGKDTTEVVQRMRELTNELSCYKFLLLETATERYSVYKQSIGVNTF
eukprot:gene16164-19238_t